MIRRFFSSLRFRLLLPFLLSVIPALGLMLYAASVQRRLVAADVAADWQRLTRIAASNQERFIEGARQVLVAVANLPEVRRRDSAACSTLLAELLKRPPLSRRHGVPGTPAEGTRNIRPRG